MNQTISFNPNSTFQMVESLTTSSSGYAYVCPGCMTGGPHTQGCPNQIAGSSDNVNWNVTWTCPHCGQIVNGAQGHTCGFYPVAQVATKPHLCPVCEGRARVLFDPDNPYASRSEVRDWACRPCQGTGVIWGY